MIVSCPSCIARYKVNEAKIKGRGAKITCPRCGHVFVVYKDQASTPPVEETKDGDDLARRDFRQVGVIWRVRKVSGATLELFDLGTLRDQIDEGEVGYRDSLSYDGGRTWLALETIASLDALFEETWERASLGQIDSTPPPAGMDDDEDEDEDDAPTTIVNREVSLADAIRKAVQAATPSAPPPRDELPRELPSRARAASPSETPPLVSASEPAPPTRAPLEVEEPGGTPLVVWLGAGTLVLLVLVALALVGLGVVDLPGISEDEPAAEEPADEVEEPAVEEPAVEEPAADAAPSAPPAAAPAEPTVFKPPTATPEAPTDEAQGEPAPGADGDETSG